MNIRFPQFSGIRCLMMPYIQGDPSSVPEEYQSYKDIIQNVSISSGDIGYLTIDEKVVNKGQIHRGKRATTKRGLHTEVGRHPNKLYIWGGGGWGTTHTVTLDADVEILLANNVDNSCAIWDTVHEDTSLTGDLGHALNEYPYEDAIFLKKGEVHNIGILTPHESIPMKKTIKRQFLRIVSSGVHGREPYFTDNPIIA